MSKSRVTQVTGASEAHLYGECAGWCALMQVVVTDPPGSDEIRIIGEQSAYGSALNEAGDQHRPPD